jgi:hypothetical protein
MSDTTRPVLKGLRFATTVDLSRGSAHASFAIDAEDAGAIAGASVWLDHRVATADGQPEYLEIAALYNDGDSWSDATPYSASNWFRLTDATSAGTYTIRQVSLHDVAGNYSSYSTAELAALGFATTFTVTGTTTDRTGPTLTGLSLPATVDLSKGTAQMTASATAVDNEGGKGADSVRLTLDQEMTFSFGSRSPYIFIGKSYSGTDSFDDITPTTGNAVFGITEATAPGQYTVREAQVVDAAGNVTSYSTEQLTALGFSTKITVTGNAADTTAPTLQGLEMPRYVDLSSGTAPVTFATTAGDGGGSGVYSVAAFFDHAFVSSKWGASPLILFGNSDAYGDNFKDATPGRAALDDVFTSATAPGVYNLTDVWVTDSAGNKATYGTDILRDMGIATRIVVGGNGKAAAPTAAASMHMVGDDLVVTFSSNAWKTGGAAFALFTYDTERIHAASAAGGPGTETTFSATESTAYGSAVVNATGSGSTSMFSLTLHHLGQGSDVSLHVNDFTIAGVKQTFAGGDVLLFRHGGAGNDTLAGGGNDWIDGGAGFDTVRYASGAQVRAVEGGFRVTDGKGIDEGLSNVELLDFGTRRIALDPEGTAADAYRLYRAAFDRPADEAGLGYWIAQMDKGLALRDVAAAFVTSPEYAALYGPGQTDQTFLTTLYSHGLPRAPDRGGLAYWLDVLAAGGQRADVLVNFSDSTENHAQVVAAIQDGVGYVPYG